jgi:hypothetical protein
MSGVRFVDGVLAVVRLHRGCTTEAVARQLATTVPRAAAALALLRRRGLVGTVQAHARSVRVCVWAVPYPQGGQP